MRRTAALLTRRATALWGAALVIAACGDPVAPLPREGAPDELEFSFAEFAIAVTTWELRGDTVVFRHTPWGAGSASDSARAVPTADAWRAFWTAADEAGVSRWRERYAAEGVVDGNGWSLRLVAGSARLESEGSNAYPDRRGRESELEVTDAFRAFRSALEDLVVGP